MITVYLDSQDYSTLSSSRLDPALQQIRDRLMTWAESGAVQFLFSSYIFSEAAPVNPHAVDFAIARGDLLSGLCGQNALLEAGQLLKDEARNLSSANGQPVDALSPTGDFFPEIEFDDLPSLDEMVLDAVPDEPYRKLIFQDGLLRPEYRDLIYKAVNEQYVQLVTAQYPMKPENAGVFARFILGEASRAEASEALRASIRDPRWLMRWLAANQELADPIIAMVRKPGREIGSKAREMIEHRVRFRTDPATRDLKDAPWNKPVAELRSDWETMTASMVMDLAKRACQRSQSPWRENTTQQDIANHCPGLNTAVRSMMDALWDSYGGGRSTRPSDSQFPDSMHSIYAPYVDVFRADRFMAPHIRRQLAGSRTTVVPLLTELPVVIERKLVDR